MFYKTFYFMPNQTREVGRGNAETLDLSWLNIAVNWGSVGLIWTSWLTVAKVCCMRIRFSVKGTDRVKEKTGKKRGQDRRCSSQTRNCDGGGKKRAMGSVRWQNNMTSHRALLRLAPLQGSAIRHRAANDVLKVNPCEGLMGPEGPAVLDAVVH